MDATTTTSTDALADRLSDLNLRVVQAEQRVLAAIHNTNERLDRIEQELLLGTRRAPAHGAGPPSILDRLRAGLVGFAAPPTGLAAPPAPPAPLHREEFRA